MALLRGLYSPNSGTHVSVDGVPMSINSIANSITLFPQEPEIFESTIEHNITLGLPFTQRDIMDVCGKALFGEIVDQLPKGLQSNIQEKE